MKAVFDTNLFVAAGFKPRSASASLIALTRYGTVTLIWDEATRSETRAVLTRIPPVSWEAVADVFQDQNRWDGKVDLWTPSHSSQTRKIASSQPCRGQLAQRWSVQTAMCWTIGAC